MRQRCVFLHLTQQKRTGFYRGLVSRKDAFQSVFEQVVVNNLQNTQMKLLQYITLFFLFGLGLASCTEGQMKSLEPKANAYGNLNNVVVIADEELINSTPGDSLMYYLQAAYPILPAPEPLFDVKVYAPAQVLSSKQRRELRTYVILADMSDKDSPTTQLVNRDLGEENVRGIMETKGYSTKVVKDRWAKGQVLIYVFAKDEATLTENVMRSFPGIVQRINEHDSRQIMTTSFFKGDNRPLEQEILDTMGVKIRLPKDYQKAAYDPGLNTFWVRFDEKEYTYNILLHKVDYRDKEQLTRESFVVMRDSIGQLVATDAENSRMVVNDTDLPLYVKGTTVNGNFALKANGIWEIENDFMGGPFVSYLIHNPNTDEIVLADGFLFAPGKSKREALQVLDNILQTIKF